MQAAVVGGDYVNLAYVSYMMSQERYLHSFAAILMWVKSFKYLEWSPRMTFLMRIIQWASMEIVYFFIIFFILFLGFAQAGYLLFSSHIFEFRSFSWSIVFLFASSVSSMNTRLYSISDAGESFSLLSEDETRTASRFMGPAYHMLFSIAMLIVTVNIFVAILNDAY